MTYSIKKPKWGWLAFIISIVLLGNILLYHTTLISPFPIEVVLGSIIDFLIFIPLLVYLFIIRKRYSIKYLTLVILAGYGTAYLIIPNQYLQSYSFFPYMLLALEGLFVAFELFILYKLIVHLPRIKKTFRTYKLNSYFYKNLNNAIYSHIKPNRMIDILISELSLFYYALFSWEKKATTRSECFTYHRNTSTVALYIAIIHATILETIGFHFLLHSWSPLVAWILLILNIYAIFFFIGEIQAIRLSPIILNSEYLYIQMGLMSRITVPITSIKEVKDYNGPEKLKRKERKDVYEAVVRDFIPEKPALELILKNSIEVNYMYGFKKEVKRILLNVDEVERFKESLNQQISS